MAQFPTVVRDELWLDDDLARDLHLTDQQTESPLPSHALIVASVVHLAGATIRGHDVTIVADEIDEAGTRNGIPGLTLITNRDEAPENTTGRAGHTLTIWTRKLGVASAVSNGQQGGIGLKGRKAADYDCSPPPVPVQDPSNARPEPIDPIPPIEQIPGPQGHQGKDGAKGGLGGRIVVHTVAPPALGDSAAARFRGVGGLAGDKGPGGDGGFGCPTGTNQGPTGLKGGTLGPGDDLAGVVTVVSAAAFEATVAAEVVGFVWADARVRAADAATRRGRPAVARLELERAAQLDPSTTAGAAATTLRSRLRNGLTSVGVERDLDVRPAIASHSAAWAAGVATYRDRVLRNGTSVFQFLSRETLLDGYSKLRRDHRKLINEDLLAVGTEREQRLAAISSQRGFLLGKLDEAAKRITALIVDQELSPAITVAGTTLDARDIATRIRDLLADETGQASDTRHLLAADLDLLTAHVENEAFPGPNSAELAAVRSRAVGLAGAALGSVSWAAAAAVISFRAVRNDLRNTAGDARLRLGIGEMVELAHRSRILQLREIQTAEGELVTTELAARAEGTQANLDLSTTQASTEQLALNWLDAAADFADLVSWRSQPAERAVTLYTLDATPAGFAHPESGSPSAASSAPLFGPDRREDLRQHAGFPNHELNAGVLSAAEHDPVVAENAYKQRATFVEGPGNSGVEHLTFSSENRQEVVLRLKEDADVWFDATVDDLMPGRLEGKVVGVGVVFVGLATKLDTTVNPPHTLLVKVEHSGISAQRRLDGKIVPQYLYPGEVEVTLNRGPTVDGQLSTNWTGEMRYDDPNDGGTPGAAEDFKLWGRGAAAGWRMSFADGGLPLLGNLEKFELQVDYDSFALPDVASLLRIDAPLEVLVPGQTVQATALLTRPAPTGGLKITLSSDDPALLSVPAAILVPAGSDRATIPIKVIAAGAKLVRLSATSPDGFRRQALVTVPKPAAGQPANVTRLDIRAPGEELAGVSGLAFAGDRLLATAGEVTIDADGTIRPAGPGNLLSVTTGPNGMSGLQRFPITKQARAIDIANGKAYVVNSDPAVYSLGIIDLATNKVLAETHIGFGPTQVAVDAAANLVYVSNWGGKSVEVFHGTTGERVASIPGLRGPQGLAVDAARRRVYVALNYFSGGPNDTENGLAVIQRAPVGNGHSLRQIIPIAGRTLPMDVAYDSNRGLIHVVNIGVAGEQLPGVTTFQASNLAVLGFTPVPGPLFCCDVHLASGAVVCGGPAAAVHVVDGVNRRTVSSQAVAHTVASIAFHQPSGAIFVGDRQKGEIIRLAPVSVDQVAWR